MAKPIPTRVGDVLILSTDQAYCVYAVGLVHAATRISRVKRTWRIWIPALTR